jgi:hypothetical protein
MPDRHWGKSLALVLERIFGYRSSPMTPVIRLAREKAETDSRPQRLAAEVTTPTLGYSLALLTTFTA